MTDPDLVAKKLAFIETCVRELRTLARPEQMVGFRNVVVHGYHDVDLGIVRDVVENRLDDLLEFAAVVRRRV